MAVTAAPRPATKLRPGTIYRGRTGQWSFVLHRVTGLAVLGFLLLHILGESFIGVSQEAFDTIEDLYKTLFFRVMEIGLLFALVYHSVNGLRITAIDFFPSLCRKQKELSIIQYVVTAALFFPPSVIMAAHYFNKT